MAGNLEDLRRRRNTAGDLDAVVRTMKALAASNISQYEMAVLSLQDYYRTVQLGIYASLEQSGTAPLIRFSKKTPDPIILIFGSDQGLVGPFNENLAHFVAEGIHSIGGNPRYWIVGERIHYALADGASEPEYQFSLPNSFEGIALLITRILEQLDEQRESGNLHALYIFHNAPMAEHGYYQTQMQLLPLDGQWRESLEVRAWPSQIKPELIGGWESVLPGLLREYLFMSLYKACAESLASENASRLAAMERAGKNIAEMLDELNRSYHHLRQAGIDEELFDVVAGFEALKEKKSG